MQQHSDTIDLHSFDMERNNRREQLAASLDFFPNAELELLEYVVFIGWLWCSRVKCVEHVPLALVWPLVDELENVISTCEATRCRKLIEN